MRDGKAMSCGGGDVLATLIGLCIQLKPTLEDMRAGVEEGLSAYAADNLKAGQAMPEVSGVGSRDGRSRSRIRHAWARRPFPVPAGSR